ncbi:hypothetical protein Tco_0963452 [Tanacetum coccineum]
MLSCPCLLLPFRSDGSLCRHPISTLGGIPRRTLPSNQSRAEGLATHVWVGYPCLCAVSRNILAIMSSSTSLRAVVLRSGPSCFPMVTVCSGYLLLTIIFSSASVKLRTPSVFTGDVVWNLMALWIIETTIPIFRIAVLPNNILYGELDLTMTKLRVSLLKRGVSPIVISKRTSPMA